MKHLPDGLASALHHGHSQKHMRNVDVSRSYIPKHPSSNGSDYCGEIMSSKWYLAYESTRSGITYISEDYVTTLEHAIEHGEFDEISGKENFMDHEQNLFFEVSEEDLKDVIPYELITR
jgi:hypothetical protein